MPRTPVLLSWSGGKDAAWTLHRLRQHDDLEVVGLLTTLTEGEDRVSMQGIRREVAHAQARAAGLPLLEAWIPHAAPNRVYEASLRTALDGARVRWPGLSLLAFGDLFLQDIGTWREALGARLGWMPLFPLFDDGDDTTALAREMVAAGLHAHLCCVDTTRLDAAFAGRAFDAALLSELPTAVDRCGEHGEFHTCAWAGPMFDAPLRLERGATGLRDGRFAVTDFVLATT